MPLRKRPFEIPERAAGEQYGRDGGEAHGDSKTARSVHDFPDWILMERNAENPPFSAISPIFLPTQQNKEHRGGSPEPQWRRGSPK